MLKPFLLLDDRVSFYIGDVYEVLKGMDDNSVDCVVTSPPYWGLRDYGLKFGTLFGSWDDFPKPRKAQRRKTHALRLQWRAAQRGWIRSPNNESLICLIGMEPTLGDHLAVMVVIFEEVRRVLKPDGTLWLNYGDCYASTPNGKSAADTKAAGKDNRTFRDKPFSTVGPVYGAMPGEPFKAANGTKRRGGGNAPSGPVYDPAGGSKGGGHRGPNRGNDKDIPAGRIVAGGFLKPKDRCLIPERLSIALQEAGWWVRSRCVWTKPNPMPESVSDRPANCTEEILLLTKSERYWYDTEAVRVGGPGYQKPNAPDKIKSPEGQGFSRRAKEREVPARNKPYSNHTKLDQTGRGKGRNLRNYEPAPERAFPEIWEIATSPFPEAHFATFPLELAARCIKAGCPKDGVVFDPFGGAGTTALAAVANGRKAVLVELNPGYADIAMKRLKKAFMGPDERKRFGTQPDPVIGPLFSKLETKGVQAC